MLSVKKEVPHLENKIDVLINNYNVDDDGFLIAAEEWTEAFAARALGLPPRSLSPQHLDVLRYVRNKYLLLGALPPVRRVCKSTGLEKSELKVLFGSCLQLWRAAGLPSPDDEIRAHMN